ncbi:MAG TPA: ribbon-helix-helix protein, CopG family [Terriglobales bacterium]
MTTTLKRQAAMKRKKGERRRTKTQSASLVRASISFPPKLYETLEEIAKQKKVSLAWVVRDAAEKYVADRTAETKEATPRI